MSPRFARRVPRGDDGASLILALMFVTGIGLVVGSLLTFSGTSLRAASTMSDRARTDYNVDGALQTAVNTVRQSTYDNAGGQTCLTGGGLDVPMPTGTVKVTCAPADGTGAAAGLVPISSANKPGSAILTLGTSGGEPGIGLSSNGTLLVKGKVVSNSSITGGGASSALSSPWAQVRAKGACTATVTSTPAAACNYTPTTDADDFADPATLPASASAYAPPPTTVSDLTYRSVPACASNLVTFQPGYYDDAMALTALTGGGGTCNGRTFWFKPGQYYFDFHNAEGGGGLTSGSDVWTVSDANARIVAGTPQGWTTSPFTAPTIPGACVSPLTTTSNAGVQFAFGGDSRLVVTAGQAEICGQYSSNKPSLAVYGMPSGADPVNTFVATTNGGGTTPSGAQAFAPLSAVKDQDDTGATTSLDSTGATGDTTASMKLTDFTTANIPAGSILQSAQLEIRHRETVTSGSLKTLQASASIDTGGTPTAVPATALTVSSGWRTDTITVPVSALQTKLHSGSAVLSSAQVDAIVAKKTGSTQNKVTVAVDSVQLRISYKPPAVRGETTTIAGSANCVGTAPYVPGSSNCALITTSGAQTRLYIQGTTYTPKAALNIALTNISAQVFRAGLISRSLRITVTASASYSGPVIEIPDDSPGFAAAPLDVYFLAYVCPSGATCTGAPPGGSWRRAGQAEVTYTDASFSPTAGSRQVTVKVWQIPR
jgi:hypothetical protein